MRRTTRRRRTPWASVARQRGRAGVLLTHDGLGHGSVTAGRRMASAVDAYLIAGTVPAPGTRCPAPGTRCPAVSGETDLSLQ